MPENKIKSGKNKIPTKKIVRIGLEDGIPKKEPHIVKTKEKKISRKVNTDGKKAAKKAPVNRKVIEDIEELPVEKEHDEIFETNNKLIVSECAEKDNIPSQQQFSFETTRVNYFIIFSILSILIFIAGGYVFPATKEDISDTRVIWASTDGKFDRGLFNQLYSSIAFTFGIFLLGYYVNDTFIKLNIKNWIFFEFGMILMLLFGLCKIGEMVFNHNIFNIGKDIVLPISLMLLAYASYKIYKDMNGAL